MKKLFTLAALVALSGCSSLSGMLDNRISCTLDGGTMLVSSMYGPIGIASKIAPADAAAVCKPGPTK